MISCVCSPSYKERIYLGSYATFTRKCPKVSDQDVETAFRIWYTIHEDVKASIYLQRLEVTPCIDPATQASALHIGAIGAAPNSGEVVSGV